MKELLLEIKRLDRFFGGLQAVRDVSFSVLKGMVKAIIGPNGAGKTTLFNLISGYLKPHSGSIIFREQSITGCKPHRIAELGISRTFQTTKLFLQMTVLENVMVGRHTKTNSEFLSALLNLPRTWREEKQIKEKAVEILEILSLTDIKDEYAANLSFGQQRWVEFARALALEPELLLLDEPAAGLNIYETQEIADLILKIREWGITILLVEHDISMVMDISDEIIVLNYGQKFAEGKPEDIQKNPEVITIYLGEDNA